MLCLVFRGIALCTVKVLQCPRASDEGIQCVVQCVVLCCLEQTSSMGQQGLQCNLYHDAAPQCAD